MSTGSSSTPADAKRKQPQRYKRSEPIDYATMAGFRRTKPQRERFTPIGTSPSPALVSSSSDDINEATPAISEPMLPQVLETHNSGPAHQINSVATTALLDPVLGTERYEEQEQKVEHEDAMKQLPTEDHTLSDETHAPGASGLEQLPKNSLLDGLFMEHGGALVIPFDVTSYPFWDDERELEDQLYRETWAANHGVAPGAVGGEAPSQTSCEDGRQPPDSSSGSSSQRQ